MSVTPLRRLKVGKLTVEIHADRAAMGQAAAQACRQRMAAIEGRLAMAFAAAPSQNEFLATLRTLPNVEWSRVAAFHLDEYIGLAAEAPQRFARFLRQNLFDHVTPDTVHYLEPSPHDPEAECQRYEALLRQSPLAIACIGIGENGHIAFNDPPVADFADPHLVKVVELDASCRQQQVNDGCFPTLADVPTHAVTLTIPAIMGARHVLCMVPGPTKAEAVARTLTNDVSTDCPASILTQHEDAILYLDPDAAARLP